MLVTDPIDFLLDAQGDIVIGADVEFSRGVLAVAQGIRRRLLKVRGEFFADITSGVPWLARDNVDESAAILGQPFDEVKIRIAVRDAILASPGVQELEDLRITRGLAPRSIAIDWTVRTIYGRTGDTTEV